MLDNWGVPGLDNTGYLSMCHINETCDYQSQVRDLRMAFVQC